MISWVLSSALDLLGLSADWLLIIAGIAVVLGTYGLAISSPVFALALKFLGPVARIVGMAMICLGAARLYSHAEVTKALAAYQQAQERAVAAARLDEQIKADRAVASAVVAQSELDKQLAAQKEKIVYEPGPSVCPTPPGLLALGSSLLRASADGGAQADAAKRPDGAVPAPAASPGPRKP